MKSWIEISAARLRANLAAIRSVAGAEFEVLAVIKADAYGHGAALCAPVLVEAGAEWLGVSDVEEGLCVRAALAKGWRASSDARIMVMCGFEPQDAPRIVAARLIPVVWTPEHVQALEKAAEEAGERVRVHLEIDTGMSRQGATPGDSLAAVLAELWRSPRVRLEGVFSHLSSSEKVNSFVTARQQAAFDEAYGQIFAGEVMPEWVHLGNSSAVDEGSTLAWLREQTQGTQGQLMVRPGLALYGYVLALTDGPSEDGQLRGLLEPVATWKTRIIGIREIPAGETVGYGATFVSKRPMRLALLPVGYADGFRREASSGLGNGWVMIGGRRASVVGRVSMNLTVVDVTEHEAVDVGDEVVLLGPGVTADDHARWCGTIPYEILCGMRGHRRLV